MKIIPLHLLPVAVVVEAPPAPGCTEPAIDGEGVTAVGDCLPVVLSVEAPVDCKDTIAVEATPALDPDAEEPVNDCPGDVWGPEKEDPEPVLEGDC